jgi:hypothetical protein
LDKNKLVFTLATDKMNHLFPSSRGSNTWQWYTVGGKMSYKTLKQWINIKFCSKICASASEMLALLTLADVEYSMKELSVSEWHG